MQSAGKWMEFEKKIVLSEVIQTQKEKSGMVRLNLDIGC